MDSTPAYLLRRWSKQEYRLLAEMRRRLATEIAECGQFPEVVGDRGLIRYIRGHGHDIDKATEMYGNYLRWRKEHNVDAVREDIARGGKTPTQFPYAHDFLERTGNQVLMSAGMKDNHGNPIAVETYEYSPKAILAGRTLDMYTEYMIYCMEYKFIIVEQLSELKERQYLKACNYNPPDLQNGYGVILQVTILRDLTGMSMEFMSADSKALLKVSLDIAQNNYPEMLYKSHLVNAGWVFSTIWYFIKGLLDVNTAAKVTTNGTGFIKALKDELSVENIPTFMGGQYDFSKEAPFVYDHSEHGPLHMFPYDGSRPSCYLDYVLMKQAGDAPALSSVEEVSSLAPTADELPPPPTGPVAVHGILANKTDHARRRSMSSEHRIQGVVLDLDGTLLDTESLSDKVIREIILPLEVDGKTPDFTADLQMKMQGLPDKAWTELVVAELQLEGVLSPSELLAQWEVKMEEMMPQVAVMSGALELIARLLELGLPLAIATSSSEKVVAMKKSAHPDVFNRISVVVCGDDAELSHGKPNPDIFLLAAKRLNIDPGHCLAVEDSATGVAAAKAAGMRVCACVNPGAASPQDPTPEAVKVYNESISSKLSDIDSMISDLKHFEFVKFGLF